MVEVKKTRTTKKEQLNERLLEVIHQGKIPPQTVEMEKIVLGMILLQEDSIYKVSPLLTSEMFYKPEHQNIYKAISNLYRLKNPIDIITVSHELKKLGLLEQTGGAYYVTSLTANLATSRNTEYYALVIREKWICREVISKLFVNANLAYEDDTDVFDLIASTKTFLTHLEQDINTTSSSIKEYSANVLKVVLENKKPTVGHGTGLILLDYRTGGFQRTDLIVVAGRPGRGKTILLIHGVRECYIKKVACAVYTYEMSGEQLVHRLISNHLSIDNNALRANKLSEQEKGLIELFNEDLFENILINDKNPNLYELLNSMERDVIEKGVQIFFIDYLQLIPTPKDLERKTRNDYIGIVSFALKTFAKKHNVPIIALAQLSRDSEKRPKDDGFTDYIMSDLRESGSLEQDADMVLFVDYSEKTGKSRIQFGKFRHGALAKVSLKFEGKYVRFKNDEDDSTTRKAMAHYEQFGEISVTFEEDLKTTAKPTETTTTIESVPYFYRDPTEAGQDDVLPDTDAPF